VKRVMILGASRYYARSIRRARAIGYQVIAVDRNPQAEGFAAADDRAVVDITDRDGVLRVARDHTIDGIVPLNDFGVETAAHVAASLGLVGITPDAAARATRKTLMRAAWDAAGLPRVRWGAASTLDEAREAARAIGRWPVVVKPADSHGGASRGVSVAAGLDELPAAVAFAQSSYADPEVIVEECLQGVEHSVETVTWEGETHVIAVSDKVKTPLPYRVDKSVDYPTRLDGPALEALYGLVTSAVRALGITVGPAHVELSSTADGPRLLELGARCGGGGTPDPIVPHLTGVDMLGEVVRLHAGDRPTGLTPQRTRGCVYRFLTPPPGRLRRIEGLEDVAAWPGVLDCAVTVAPGDQLRPVRVGADRAGFVIAGGRDRDEATAIADAAEAGIRFICE
jgi:biotin carboxylase